MGPDIGKTIGDAAGKAAQAPLTQAEAETMFSPEACDTMAQRMLANAPDATSIPAETMEGAQSELSSILQTTGDDIKLSLIHI